MLHICLTINLIFQTGDNIAYLVNTELSITGPDKLSCFDIYICSTVIIIREEFGYFHLK